MANGRGVGTTNLAKTILEKVMLHGISKDLQMVNS